MRGDKKEKAVQTPPPALPEGVVFHVMPGTYQGVKGQYAPPPPPITNQEVVTGSAPDQGDRYKAGQVPAKKTVVPPPPPTAFARPTALLGGKKILIMWGVIALVVLVGGGLAAFLLIPGTQTPVVPPQPATTLEPIPAPQPEPTPTPSPEPEFAPPPVTPEPPIELPLPEIVSSTDTDFDGLTDAEETLYTTDPAKADKDDDGYLDGQEVENLYNPTGNAPIRIVDSNLVARYTNSVFGYSIFYPASWAVRALDDKNPREVLFTAATGEFIQVIVDDNSEGLSALQWYAKQFPAILPESLERIFVDNLEGAWTKDMMTVYLTKIIASANERRLLFGITYNYGERTSVNFRTTFKMMLKSFSVL